MTNFLWIKYPKPEPKTAPQDPVLAALPALLDSIPDSDTHVRFTMNVHLPGVEQEQIISQVGWLLDQMAEQWRAVGAIQAKADAVWNSPTAPKGGQS